MAQFEAFEAGIEVNGATIMSVVAGMGAFQQMARSYLQSAGLGEVVADAEHWYPQQAWLDCFRKIAQNVGENTLVAIGAKIPASAVFPPDIDSIEKALDAIDVAYHMNHRNKRGETLFDPVRRPNNPMLEGIGHYSFQKVADKPRGIMVCNNPYPCAFDRGLVDAMARRFGRLAEVSHDDTQPCRKKAAASCTYLVSWL